MTSAEQNPNEISSVVCCLGDSSQNSEAHTPDAKCDFLPSYVSLFG